MFSATVPEKRKGSCETYPTWRRRLSRVKRPRGVPSRVISPASGS
jgi:hypothetical protein